MDLEKLSQEMDFDLLENNEDDEEMVAELERMVRILRNRDRRSLSCCLRCVWSSAFFWKRLDSNLFPSCSQAKAKTEAERQRYEQEAAEKARKAAARRDKFRAMSKKEVRAFVGCLCVIAGLRSTSRMA